MTARLLVVICLISGSASAQSLEAGLRFGTVHTLKRAILDPGGRGGHLPSERWRPSQTLYVRYHTWEWTYSAVLEHQQLYFGYTQLGVPRATRSRYSDDRTYLAAGLELGRPLRVQPRVTLLPFVGASYSREEGDYNAHQRLNRFGVPRGSVPDAPRDQDLSLSLGGELTAVLFGCVGVAARLRLQQGFTTLHPLYEHYDAVDRERTRSLRRRSVDWQLGLAYRFNRR